MPDRREQSSAAIAGDRDGDERLSAETERAYDATVERYGARWNVVDPLVDAKREFVAAAGPSAVVADVGCGTGRDLAWFTGEGHRAIGVDRSRRMLQFAAAAAPTAALVRATFATCRSARVSSTHGGRARSCCTSHQLERWGRSPTRNA